MKNYLFFALLLPISYVAFAGYYSLLPPDDSELSPKSQQVNADNWREAVRGVNKSQGAVVLPLPRAAPKNAQSMNLREAVMLSLRNNPTVQITELERVAAKFGLIDAHKQFEPTYSLTASSIMTNGSGPRYDVSGGVKLNTALGTALGMTVTPKISANSGVGKATFNITQPLLRGFGERINRIPWYNALDNENQSRLFFKSAIIAEVTRVILAYRQLVQDYLQLDVRKHVLEQDAKQLKFSQLKYQVGKQALSDLLQQQANFENTQLDRLDQNNHLIQDKQNLLNVLGLKASTKINIDTKLDFSRLEHIPKLDEAIEIALENNIEYQADLIGIKEKERNLQAAQDQRRWQLSMGASVAVEGGHFLGGGGVSRYPKALRFDLTIPIDDVSSQQAVVNAKVALEVARLNTGKVRLSLVREVTNQVQQLQNQYERLKIAVKQLGYQRMTLKQARTKYRFGRITTFEFNALQNQLLSQESRLISSRIELLNRVTSLEQFLGITLETWHVKLRY